MISPPSKRQAIPFGKYLLLDRINIGGMAEVWRGKMFGSGGFERLVAIKRILPNIAEDEEFITMFIDEAKISVQLTHANVAQIYELGHIANSYFIAMEYIPGKDMRAIFDRCRKRGELAPIPLVAYVVAKMCEGLDYAHRKKDAAGHEMNIVHRDVSPPNILITYDGDVKVIDFGIAKAAGKANTTQAGILKGKFGYMSPEQIRGQPLDRRSDIFAIGICLYEMLTGERLFVGESDFSVLEKVRKSDVPPPSRYNSLVTEPLEKIVLKALSRDVEQRYQYASELGDDLQRFLLGSEHLFGRKDLAQYMRTTFAEDVERERRRLEEYAEIRPPERVLEGGGSGGAPALPLEPDSSPTGPEAQQVLASSGALPTQAPAPPVAAPPPATHPPRRTLLPPPIADGLEDASSGEEDPRSATLLVDGREYFTDASEPITEPGEEKGKAKAKKDLGNTFRDVTAPEPPTKLVGGSPFASANAPALDRPAPPALFGSGPHSPRPAPQGLRRPVVREPVPFKDRSADPVSGSLSAAARHLKVPRAVIQWATDERNRLTVLVGLGGLALFAVAVVTFLLMGQGPKGYIVLELPADQRDGARISINGDDIDKPASWPMIQKADIGPALVVVSAEGYRTFTQSIDVTEGPQVARLDVALQPVTRKVLVVVVTDPPAAELKLNGKQVRYEGDQRPYVGEVLLGHEVTVEASAPGYRPYVERLKVREDKVLQLDLKLELDEYAVRVESSPSGATILVNGRDLGRTPSVVRVPSAAERLTLRLRCFDQAEVSLSPPKPGEGQPAIRSSLRRRSGCR